MTTNLYFEVRTKRDIAQKFIPCFLCQVFEIVLCLNIEMRCLVPTFRLLYSAIDCSLQSTITEHVTKASFLSHLLRTEALFFTLNYDHKTAVQSITVLFGSHSCLLSKSVSKICTCDAPIIAVASQSTAPFIQSLWGNR